MKRIIICIFFVLCSSLLCYGNIYFWIDDNGIKHFTNIAPPPEESIKPGESVEEFKESITVFKGQIFKVLKVFDGDTIKVKGLAKLL